MKTKNVLKTCSMAMVLFFFSEVTFGQVSASEVRGIVADSTSGRVLEQASVRLISQRGEIVIRQTVSSRTGFVLARVPIGEYMLVSSYVGYRNDSLPVMIYRRDTVVNTGKIVLHKASTELVEVIVKTVIPPVVIRNDTIVFNANAYKTKPNATVEDLIKKMPGIEVDKAGNITMQGQKVEKIYIDGKAFFLDDPKLATQRLNAEMIAQVEVFDEQSDRAKLTGIKESDARKGMNLTLKKNMKKSLTGKVYAGYGTQDRYAVGADATRFSESIWFSGNLVTNNANNAFNGAGTRAGPSGSGISSATNGSFNYRDNWGKKITAVADYTAQQNATNQTQTSTRKTFLTDSTLNENRARMAKRIGLLHKLNFMLTYEIDSFTKVVLQSNVGYNSTNSNNRDSGSVFTGKGSGQYLRNIAGAVNAQSENGNDYGYTVNLARLGQKKGRTFYATISNNFQSRDQTGNINTSTRIFANNGSLSEQRLVDQRFDQSSPGKQLTVSAAYSEPISVRQTLDVKYTLSRSDYKSFRRSFNYNALTMQYDLSDTLTTNDFHNVNLAHRFGFGYNSTQKTISYQAGVEAEYASQQVANDSKGTSLQQQFVNWFPRASLNYRMAKSRNLNIGYMGRSSSPTITQLQPIVDLSNPQIVRIGNPLLKQQFANNVTIRYSASNPVNFRNIFVSIGVQNSLNKIVPFSTVANTGIQTIQYVNVNGSYSVSSNLSYGFPLSSDRKQGNGNFNMGLLYGRDVGFVNGLENIRRSVNGSAGLSLNYNFADKLFFEFNSNINYTHAAFSIRQGLITTLVTQNYDLDVSYELPFGISLTSNYSLDITGAQQGLPGQQVMIWNAALKKYVFRNRSGEVRLSAFDLLNNNTGFRQFAGDNYIESSNTDLLRRLFMIGFVYHFKMYR